MRKRKLFSLLLCCALLICLGVNAMAADLSDTGTLRVYILETGTKAGIKGAQVNIYQIASVTGNAYTLTETFAECGFDVDRIGELTASENQTEAARLAGFVKDNEIKFTRAKITNSSGIVNHNDIELGLYLVTEAVSPEGHNPISPFLITVPQVVNGEYIYTVDATPKTGTSDPTPTEPSKPTEPTTPTTPTSPTSPTSPTTTNPTTPDEKLPQTGQLWWPVYLLTAAGLTLFFYGWLRRRSEHHA